MFCSWCGKELHNDFGYSETGEIICASYSTPTTKIYNACKAKKARLKAKAMKISDTSEKREIDLSRTLTEALQIIITQNDELIALQRQQLNAPKPQIVTNTKVISTTTFEAPSDLDDDDIWGDVEIKQDTSTTSSKTFLDQMKAMQAGEGVWAKKDMKQ